MAKARFLARAHQRIEGNSKHRDSIDDAECTENFRNTLPRFFERVRIGNLVNTKHTYNTEGYR